MTRQCRPSTSTPSCPNTWATPSCALSKKIRHGDSPACASCAMPWRTWFGQRKPPAHPRSSRKKPSRSARSAKPRSSLANSPTSFSSASTVTVYWSLPCPPSRFSACGCSKIPTRPSEGLANWSARIRCWPRGYFAWQTAPRSQARRQPARSNKPSRAWEPRGSNSRSCTIRCTKHFRRETRASSRLFVASGNIPWPWR